MVDDGETVRQLWRGVVGTGLVTRRLHWPALRQMLDCYRIVAFANDTRRPAEEFAALTGLAKDGAPTVRAPSVV